MSPDEAIFIHPAAPLLPQHVHVAAHSVGHSTGQLAPTNHCRSSWISGSVCWAANNWSLKLSLNWYSPKGVVKAVFSRSCCSTSTCQYPLTRSRVENHCAHASASKVSSILRSG
ncbi:hypothetical protein T03_15708 [Trichinella britovi]|uniref:Uncharacterized protein n=1 Tax=Trichinella britovi TaxID=45882 RepID=A0A0V1D4K7_TRIBR|nr:hypothetical protein T03_15708 [Trichinella britovi]